MVVKKAGVTTPMPASMVFLCALCGKLIIIFDYLEL